MRPLIQRDILWEKEIRTQTLVKGRPCGGTGRRRPPESQGARPRERPSPLIHWPQTLSLQNREKVSFCCWSHPLCGTWLELPGLTEALKEVIAKVRKAFFLCSWGPDKNPFALHQSQPEVPRFAPSSGAVAPPSYLHHRNAGVDRRPHRRALKSSSYHTIGSFQWLRQCDDHSQSSSLGGKKVCFTSPLTLQPLLTMPTKIS